MHINDLLTAAIASRASDLHLKVGSVPIMRVDGVLLAVPGSDRLGPMDTEAIAASVMTSEQAESFRRSNEVDLAYSVAQLGRFRANVFRQRGTVGIVVRIIPFGIRSIDDLDLPPVIKQIAAQERGLILVTGTTGSGKSTTLAAMIDHVNATRAAHILTIEDPIEFLHRDRLSIVNQREVAVDTLSFAAALRSALRQDPDVILVGEMRDAETIEIALSAAETGHLVFSTLHTLDATETISRIISTFPPHNQRQVRLQLSSVLKAAISLRLIPRGNGRGRVPAVEVMVTTPFIRECIVEEDRTSLIHGAIVAGRSQYGTQSFDQSIFALHEQGAVTQEEAFRWVSNVDEFRMKLHGIITETGQRSGEAAPAGRAAAGAPNVRRFGD